MPYNPGLLAVSLYKPSDGTTYQLDGADIAPDSEGYLNQGNFLNQAKGGERTKNRTVTFEVRHNDSTFHTNLTGDADFENRSWRMTAAEFDGAILWYETVRVVVTEEKSEIDPESEDAYPFTFRMKFVGSSPAIARGTNLIYAYNKTQGFASAWQDSDSNNIPDGSNITSGAVTTWTSGVVELDAQAASFVAVNFVITFPITGIGLTASSNYTSLATDTEINLRSRNFAGSTITENVVNVSSTGRKSSDLTTPSNIYDLLVQPIRIGSNGADNTCEGEDPALRLNSSTEYVDY